MSDANLALARERIGHVLKERWLLEDVLGVGGMAVVFAARHRNGARTAIKLLHGQLSEDPVVRERFLREAYLANSIEHEGVVRVLDDDADPQFGPFIVMELLEGESILDLLEKGITFDIPRCLDIADQALDVLANAHERGIVHRDLKPANLFLCRNGVVKVLDFGIARILDENAARLTRTGVPLGTPAYMAPEQARGLGRIADARADIYALGATIFRIIAGRHVHVGHGAEQIAKVATQRAPKMSDVCKVPPFVALIVDRALEFEPERRYQTAREMQGDVRMVRTGRAPAIASKQPPPAGAVPGLPAITPRRRPSSPQQPVPSSTPDKDPVTLLAESARERAHAIARRPDAFTVQASIPTGPTGDEDSDENMPTVAAPPKAMPIGPAPLAVSRPAAPQPAAGRPPARPFPAAPAVAIPPSTATNLAPRRSPSGEHSRVNPNPPSRPPSSGGRPRATQNVIASGESETSRAAAAFAHLPNVPVPVPPSRSPSMAGPPPAPAPNRTPPQSEPAAPRARAQEEQSIPDSPTLTSYQAPAAFAFVKPRQSELPPENPAWIEKTQKKIGSGENPSAPVAFGAASPSQGGFVPAGSQGFGSAPQPHGQPVSQPMSPRPATPSLASHPGHPSMPGPAPTSLPTPPPKSKGMLIAVIFVIALVVGAGVFFVLRMMNAN